MKSKTDKRSSLDHVMHYIDRKAEFGKTIPVATAKRAAQYAFNAGRESTINNIELSWEGGHYSSTIFNIEYKIIYSPVSKEYWIMFGEEWLGLDFSSKNEAKQAANED